MSNPIDRDALKAALTSDAYRCPGCDDGELRAEMQTDDPNPSHETEEWRFTITQPCRNGCRIEPSEQDANFQLLMGAFYQRQELYVQFFPDDMCRCDEPPFMRDL